MTPTMAQMSTMHSVSKSKRIFQRLPTTYMMPMAHRKPAI